MTLRRVRSIGFVLALALVDLARTQVQEGRTLPLDPLTPQEQEEAARIAQAWRTGSRSPTETSSSGTTAGFTTSSATRTAV